MKKSCLFFDKKYKYVSFIVHYKGLTLMHSINIYNVIIFLLSWQQLYNGVIELNMMKLTSATLILNSEFYDCFIDQGINMILFT